MIKKSKYIPKGWGFERVIVNDLYCGKELFIARDRKFSLHYHEKKDETFYVIKGLATLVWKQLPPEERWSDPELRRWVQDAESIVLHPGDVIHIPVRMVHQITAISDFTMMEVSTHHEDDDSFRIIRGD